MTRKVCGYASIFWISIECITVSPMIYHQLIPTVPGSDWFGLSILFLIITHQFLPWCRMGSRSKRSRSLILNHSPFPNSPWTCFSDSSNRQITHLLLPLLHLLIFLILLLSLLCPTCRSNRNGRSRCRASTGEEQLNSLNSSIDSASNVSNNKLLSLNLQKNCLNFN